MIQKREGVIDTGKIITDYNIDSIKFGKFVNTAYFSEAARDYETNKKVHGVAVYTRAPVGSREFEEYWDLQEQRCRDGYKIGDLYITGRQYFYLNFFRILRSPKKDDKDRNKTSAQIQKEEGFPSFWAIQWLWFNFTHISRYGGKFLGVESEGGLDICALKTRGAGYSFMDACDNVYNYNFIDDSKSYIMASNSLYLEGVDGIMPKIQVALNFLNNGTCGILPDKRFSEGVWKRNRVNVAEEPMIFQSGYKSLTGDILGRKSLIGAIICDNPNKARGARGMKITLEEGGSFPNLLALEAMTQALVKDGGNKTGSRSLFGCICAGTKVWTSSGELVNIEDLKQEQGILGYNGQGISKEEITYMQEPIEKPCYRITLENDIVLECSDDHPILCSKPTWKNKGNKLMAFKRAKNLKVGEYAMVIDEVPLFGTEKLQDARLVGLLIGDGSYGNYKSNGYETGGVEIVATDEDIIYFIENNYKATIKKIQTNKSNGEQFIGYTLREDIKPLLRKIGIDGQTKLNKRLPVNIDQYDKESLAELIGGYFDADGSVKSDPSKGIRICLSSIVKPLLQQVKYVLLKFGIHSTIVEENPRGGFGDDKDKTHRIYRLYINRQSSVLKFYENISFLCDHKQTVLSEIEDKYINPNNQRVNTGVFHSKSIIGSGNFSGMKDMKGVQIYKIKSVESIGIKTVYNLTANTTHTYLANGIVTHNTGGEQGSGIEGLESIFNNPRAFGFMPFPNIWEGEQDEIGFFCPSYLADAKVIDSNGNSDVEAHVTTQVKLREAKKGVSNATFDKHVAEFPFVPSEALKRLSGNIFNLAKIEAQIKKIEFRRETPLRYGELIPGNYGKIKFEPSKEARARALETYPHDQDKSLDGCITILQAPFEIAGKVPQGMYFIVVDNYGIDEAIDKTSLFSAYVYKYPNVDDVSYSSLPVAWYNARPNSQEETCFPNLLKLSLFYGEAEIMGERNAAGQQVINFFKNQYKAHLLMDEPDISTATTVEKRKKPKFMAISTDTKISNLQYAAEHLNKARYEIDDEGEEVPTVITNYDCIEDLGWLQEMKKFNLKKGNFDRISANSMAPIIIKQKRLKGIETLQKNSTLAGLDKVMNFSASNRSEHDNQLISEY